VSLYKESWHHTQKLQNAEIFFNLSKLPSAAKATLFTAFVNAT
jgi:hypothetical protein